MIIEAIVIMFCAGLLFGAIIGIFSNIFVLKEDPLVAEVTKLLPGFNCGGCGYPGCENFAKALVSEEATKISLCKPSKPDVRVTIKEYFATHQNIDGNIVEVDI